MELREYWSIVRRRWWIVAAVTLLALIASGAVALRGAAAYTTQMELAVSVLPNGPDTTPSYYDRIYYANLSAEYLADDLSQVIPSEGFQQEVSNLIGIPITPAKLADATRTKKTHRLIDVTISTATPEEGKSIGQAVIQIVNDPARIGKYLRQLDAYTAQVSVVNEPVTARPGSLRLLSEVGLRTLVGLLLGLGLAFLVDYLDPTLRTRQEAERALELPVLAEIPRARRRAAA